MDPSRPPVFFMMTAFETSEQLLGRLKLSWSAVMVANASHARGPHCKHSASGTAHHSANSRARERLKGALAMARV